MRVWKLTPVLFVVVAAGCGGGGGSSDRAPSGDVTAAASKVVRLDVGGPAVLALPKASTKRVVIYAHGSNGTGDDILSTPLRAPAAAALLRAGWAVAGADAEGNNWGSRSSVRDYTSLATRLRARGLTDVSIVGESMGGLDAVQAVRAIGARSLVAIYPVCDLSTMVARYREPITKAGTEVRSLSPAPFPRVRGLAVTVLASPADTVVAKDRNADVCAARARQSGADVREIPTTGDHADPSNWAPAQVVAAVER